jgi:hypothetical protein
MSLSNSGLSEKTKCEVQRKHSPQISLLPHHCYCSVLPEKR